MIQDTKNVFSFLRFIICVFTYPEFTVRYFSYLFWSFLCAFLLMLWTHPFVPIACLGSQDECFSCLFNEAEVTVGMFV